MDKDGIFVGELHQINQAVGMNQPIEKLLYEFALRSDCEDIQNFSDVFLFAKRSGGDFHKIIATTIEHISDKIEVEREVQTVISAKEDGTEDYECNSCFHYFISESDIRRIFGTIVWKYFWN